MRALLKKELTEVLVPFGTAFAVIVIVWLASVRFWDALLPPATAMLMAVALSSALAGAVLGYVQFSGERWRGKVAYLSHRGTGVEGAFLAKTIAGLLGTALVGFGPPALYAMSASVFSPNAPIIQTSLLWVYASTATVGSSLYALAALAANLRRRALVGVLLIPLGGSALWAISEFCGPPWGNARSAWGFPAMHLALATALLLLVRRLARSGADPDLALPRGAHLAIVALTVPLVLFPCDIGASILQNSLLSEARSDYPLLVRDRANGEIFPALRASEGGGYYGFYRLSPGGDLGELVDLQDTKDPERGFDVAFWGEGLYGFSTLEPKSDRLEQLRMRSYFTRGGLTSINLATNRHFDDGLVESIGLFQNLRAYLDRNRGTVRAFAFVPNWRPSTGANDLRRAPFAIELEKPGSDRSFSSETIVLTGQGEAARRLIEANASGDSTRSRAELRLLVALLDPEDGSLWRLDVLDTDAPLTRVELPSGDRFVRVESLYRRDALLFGRYQSFWEDLAVVGERGEYAWNGREFVEFTPWEAVATAKEAKSLARYRVVVDDPDPLRCKVRILDAKDDRELFAYAYAPRTTVGAALAAATQSIVLLRSPLANTLVFTGVIPREFQSDPTFQVRTEFLAEGRRPWLLLLHLAIGLGCAGACARLLRRRNAPAAWIGLGSLFVLLFGPVALLVVWLLEPKAPARELPTAPALHETALAIQSA